MNIIKTMNLQYKVHNLEIIKNINIEINEGDFVSVVGPNGAGKSTLIKLISKLINKTSGEIEIKGKNIEKYKRKELSKILAYVPQFINLDYNFTVEEIVLMGRTPYIGMFFEYTKEDLKIVENVMKKTGIYELKDEKIQNLSGGEKQRAIIARGLAQNAKILVLDEPISNLDIYMQIEIMKLLEELNEKEKITIICILHDLNMALKYTKKSVMLNKGIVVEKGITENVINEKNINNVFNVKVAILNKVINY